MYTNETKANLVIDYYEDKGIKLHYNDGLTRGHPLGMFEFNRLPNRMAYASISVLDNIITFTTYFRFKRSISQTKRSKVINQMINKYGIDCIDAIKSQGKISYLELIHKFDFDHLDKAMLDKSNLVDTAKNFKAYSDIFDLDEPTNTVLAY